MKLRITPLNWRLLKKVGALQLSLAGEEHQQGRPPWAVSSLPT